MKTKVCFFSLNAYPLFNPESKENFGGAELQSYLFATELAKNKDYDVSFIVGDFFSKKKAKPEVVKGVKIFKIRVSAKPGIYERLRFNFEFFKLLKEVDADIYQQRALGMPTGIIAFYCQLFRKKFIHMSACEADFDVFNQPFSVEKHVSIYGVRNSDLVIVQNKSDNRKLFKRYGKRGVVIKNILDFSEQYKDYKKDIILWVASSQSHKRPEAFLEIAKNHPDLKFVMVMPEHAQNREIYLDINRQAKQIKNLKMLPKVPFCEVNEYFKRAKLFINTSTIEGFPNTFVQSCAYGTPILSLKVNPDDFLNKNQCGFAFNDDLSKLSNKITQIIKNKKLWDKLSKNAYNYASKTHSLKENFKIYLKELEKLTKK